MSTDPDRLSDLLTYVRRLLAETAHLAPGNLARNRRSTASFLRFADHHGLGRDLGQLDAVDLAAYIYDRLENGGVKPQSAYVYAYGIARDWRAYTGSPEAIEALAMQVIADARRGRPAEPTQPAAVIPLWLLHELLDQIQVGKHGYDPAVHGRTISRWRAARDRALYGVLFGAALRPNEALEASVHQLRRRNDGWQLRLLASKTNPTGQRHEVVFIADDDLLGSGRLLTEWLEVRGELAHDGLFPGSNDGIPLSHKTAATRLERAVRRCGHTDGAISLWSFRRTRATLALQAGADIEDIRRLLRHDGIAASSNYLDPLPHLAADTTAIADYLATTRPDGADANGLGPGTPTPAAPFAVVHRQDTLPRTPIARLREQALAAAARGADPVSDDTRRERQRIAATWHAFCHTHGIDPAAATAEQLGAWIVSARRRGLAASTLETYLSALIRHTATTDGAVLPPTWKASQVLEAYRRQDADRPARLRGTEVSRHRLIALLEATAPSPAETASLDRALLRRHLAAAGVDTAGTVLTDDDVALAADGTQATVSLAGRAVVLQRDANPLLCPLRALQRRCAEAQGATLVDEWKLNAGALHPHGLHGRVEDWTEPQWRRAGWILSTRLRKTLRLQLLVALAFGGPLFTGELRRARLEHLTRDERGYLLDLPADGSAAAVRLRLDATGDELCPVATLDGWRAAWPHRTGPLLPAFIDHRALDCDPGSDLLSAAKTTASTILRPLSEHFDRPLTVDTLVAGRIAEEWDTHGDLAHVRRLLRHQKVATTLAYLRRHGLPTSNPTAKLSTAPGPRDDPRRRR